MSKRIILLGLTIALAVVLGFWSFTPQYAVELVRHYGYWLILIGAVSFAVAFLRSMGAAEISWRAWRSWLGPAVISLGAAAFLHLHEPHEFKIVADEVVLGLTAKEMHFSREASVSVRGYEYAGNFASLVSYVDKRPLFFPFLVASVHDLTGFRPENVFIVNGLLSILLMALVLAIGRWIDGWAAGIAAVLLIATIPLVAQNACGAGFELLNLVMILLTTWLGMRAADRPDDDNRLGAFVLSGVLLAQVRYESALFILPVAGTVLYLWWKAKSIRLPWPLLAAPLLLLVCPLQMNVFKLSRATWQLNDVAGADEPFGLHYFYDNIGHAFNFFLTTDGSQPNSILVGVLGVLGVGFFVLVLYKRHRVLFQQDSPNAVLAIFLIGLLVHTVLMLCYFWGRWDDPIIRRLSLPAHLLLVFALVFVWPQLVSHPRRWQILTTITVLYLFGFTIPTNSVHRFTQQNFAARTNNWIESYVRGLGQQTALAIDRTAGLVWILHDKSSVTAAAIAGRPDGFLMHFRNHTFDNCFLVQRATPEFGTGIRFLDAEDDMGGALQTQLIEERAFGPFYLVRLSRITGVDEKLLKEWAKKRLAPPPAPESTSQSTTVPPVSVPPAKEQQDQLLTWLRQLP